MSKKSSKKSSKLAVKLVAVLIVLAMLFGFGASEIGIEKLLEAESFEEIFAMTGEILQGGFSGDSGIEGADDSLNGVESSSNSQGQVVQMPAVDGSMQVYYFSVGQADCTLIASDGEYMLIDAGNNEDGPLIAAQLERMGVEEIQYLIGTHPHEDHIGGLDDVLAAVEVEHFYMPDNEYDSATYRSVIKAAKSAGVKVVEPKIGHTFSVGEAVCEIMGVDGNAEDANHMSIIVEVTHGENKFLFMGDAETPNEELRLWNDVDILKAGHHGSSTSSSDDFLEQTMPEVAVISCGKGNSYGHPHRETIQAFKSSGIKYYRTDTEGTIQIDSDGKNYEVKTLDIDLDGNEE